ncbi:PREDICTED: bleomycin hydrolase isoform X1 [Cercocebus atys]|uniref:bleomycin hydrolase isoform X1 n=1 Tax=Cercocebus atys TaxID=9531 RepID=UPI0005F39914|nr:PREDICTED: bleomycin hydrolase isoform X1 [Cercocebus atys]
MLILIFSVKLQDTQCQQLRQPQVHYLHRAQLLGSYLDCEDFVGPQRTHILKRETNQGYLCMTDEWFSEYVYEVVVDRKHVPEEVLAVLEQEPIVLPAWDPMGALAE